MDKIIFKVNAGTATTPTYLIIAMEFSLLNIDFLAEIQPIRINIATGAKEFTTLQAACNALLDEEVNNYCQKNSRIALYNSNCN